MAARTWDALMRPAIIWVSMRRSSTVIRKPCAQGSGWNTSLQTSVLLNLSVAHLAANDLHCSTSVSLISLPTISPVPGRLAAGSHNPRGTRTPPDAAKVCVELAGESPGG